MEANRYQKAKARMIAAVLIRAAAESQTPLAILPSLAASMTESQWRTVAFQAQQPVADQQAKALTVAYLLKVAA